MGREEPSIDKREQRLIAAERAISRLRGMQMEDLAELDTAQVAAGDGSRSLSEWTAARLDMAPETAKTLVRTMRRMRDRPDLQERLEEGDFSFDRSEALSRIPEDVGYMEWADISAVRREAAKRSRVSADAEFRSARDRFLVMQPSLDESWWRLWGGLDGPSGALVDKVLTEAADALPELPDGPMQGEGWRRATALVETLVADEAPPASISVFVDAKHAAATDGESGIFLEAGPRVGREALQAILCDADTEVIGRAEDGRYLDYGRRRRTSPPAQRRALLDYFNHTCGADGCTSRRRLQVHHLTPWPGAGKPNRTKWSCCAGSITRS